MKNPIALQSETKCRRRTHETRKFTDWLADSCITGTDFYLVYMLKSCFLILFRGYV